MITNLNFSSTTTDNTGCDKEPIHIPGLIQPFGILLCLNAVTLTIEYASANADVAFGVPGLQVLGGDLNTILSAPSIHSIKSLIRDGDFVSEEVLHLESQSRLYKWSACIHRFRNNLILELEPKAQTAPALITSSLFGRAISRMQNTQNLPELLQAIAAEIKLLSGFDRVMIYKFHEDNHGEVVAEAVDGNIDSYLGLHFPASDIPSQARAMFMLNWVRMIADVDYEPVNLYASNGATALDLSQCALRSVSPIHIEYLKNMRVKASLTVSLIKESKLWGLVACHSTGGPKYLSPELRQLCEVFGHVASSEITNKTLSDEKLKKGKLLILRQTLTQAMTKDSSVFNDVFEEATTLLELVAASGAAVAIYVNGRWLVAGLTPSDTQMNALTLWLDEYHAQDAVFHTDNLAHLFPEALAYKDVASGLLSISVPKNAHGYILWFKPEVLMDVTWAGNPNKERDHGPGEPLRPRSSFANWSETVKLRSTPWKPEEVEEAFELRNVILALDLKRQINLEKEARGQAEEATLRKEELLAAVSHDLKNPLALLRISLALFETLLSKSEAQKIESVASTMERTIDTMDRLIGDLLSIAKIESGTFSIAKATCLATEICDRSEEQFGPIASAKDITLECRLEGDDVELCCDLERVMQVCSNLIGNAIKFSPNGTTVSFRARVVDLNMIFSVEDSGSGIPEENHILIFDRFWQAKQSERLGTGLGLAIAKGIVEAHKGQIWVESTVGKGSIFCFSLPMVKVKLKT